MLNSSFWILFSVSSSSDHPIIMKRLDAHYDWLPSPSGVFQEKSVRVVLSGNGCGKDAEVNNAIAMVTNVMR